MSLGKTDVLAPKMQANARGKASDTARKKNVFLNKMWRRSAAVDKVLQNVTYLYVEHANSGMVNSALYTEHIN